MARIKPYVWDIVFAFGLFWLYLELKNLNLVANEESQLWQQYYDKQHQQKAAAAAATSAGGRPGWGDALYNVTSFLGVPVDVGNFKLGIGGG